MRAGTPLLERPVRCLVCDLDELVRVEADERRHANDKGTRLDGSGVELLLRDDLHERLALTGTDVWQREIWSGCDRVSEVRS